MVAVGDPGGKNLQLAEFADGSDAAEVESSLAGELLNARLKISDQWSVGSGQWSVMTTSFAKATI